jgi:very-short-patch-repair endonuclease
MSYKDSLHPQVSNAEMEIFEELSKRGLTRGMLTQLDVILKKTKPDFAWFEKRKCVYLDGEQVHWKRQEKDEETTSLLEKQGWRVLRISYKAPLTREKLAEIISQIQAFISGDPEEVS